MSRPLRVVHLPARTPYARKITSPGFAILNETTTEHGFVPAAVTAQWVLDRRPLDWLDVLHLHHIEFDDLPTLERLLAACSEAQVRVVFTAHDLTPMFTTAEDFHARLELIATSPVAWIGLTQRSIDALHDLLPELPEVTLIPHGYVVNPDDIPDQARRARAAGPRYLLYGALRPNRDHLATLTNWSLGVADPGAALHLLLRGFSAADFRRYDIPGLLATVRSDHRIQATAHAYPSDHDVVAAGLSADALLLPYLFGSHSGQLELAFDLNLLPISSSTGYLVDQYEKHKGLVTEPIWFDWADGHEPLYGERLLAALEAAHRRLTQAPPREPDTRFLEYRRQEHRELLDAHAVIYAS
jgi:hypothetical protein